MVSPFLFSPPTDLDKSLSPLVSKINKDQINLITDKLCQLTFEKSELLREVAALALKTVLTALPIDTTLKAEGYLPVNLIPKTLDTLQDKRASHETLLEYLDLLSVVLQRFGAFLNVQITENIFKALYSLLAHERAAIRKRTVVTLGNWSRIVSSHVYENGFSTLLNSSIEPQKNPTLKLALLQALHSIR